jgi:mycothiol synthase
MLTQMTHARSYAGEADIARLLELFAAVRAVDPLEDAITADGLRTEFSEPGFDPARDMHFWDDADGRLVAFAQLYFPQTGDEPDAFFWYRVHPALSGSDLAEQAFAWVEQRVAEAERERNVRLKLRGFARKQETEYIALLERHGFSVARYFFRMARPLAEPIPEPVFPAGYTLTHTAGVADAARWVEVYNESFIDHYNFHPLTPELHAHWLQDSAYRPERDLVATAADGTWAAFCLCAIDPAENELNGRNEGWIRLLGTRRGHRKLGLGRAMLLAGLRRLKADGVETAVLGVDAANPTGALGLYESVGFYPIREFVGYVRES